MVNSGARHSGMDPLGLEAAAALARQVSGCEGACIRLADDGLGRPGVRFFPHRTDVTDLPSAFLPHDMPPIAGATELSGLGFWVGIPLHDAEGSVIGILGVFDSRSRTLPDDGMDALIGLGRIVSARP